MRKRKNRLVELRDSNGIMQEDSHNVEQIVMEYFKNLFNTLGDRNLDDVLDTIETTLGEQDIEILSRDFTGEEVQAALFQMHPNKAPGPDGMSPSFFQNFCHVVGNDIIECCLNFLNHGIMLREFNVTNIALVPKCTKLERMIDLRPISLCNVVYKIMFKCLANRIKPLLSTLIYEQQSAFIPGRLIMDNILVAYETLHCLRKNKSENNGTMAVKLDMSKVYDRVEWDFLEGVKRRMGFPMH